ncbi:MAG: ubiquinone/menaquinone biosynthesis C-methylase UbiE [Verrucomicrobiales bacterium]|jgi:ubiquinone/menaquinone biosynthesis C-methylase UbiE/DNA-binding HxlR family transcriptional regulator
MLSITHCLKLLSDSTRLRILLLLDQSEVSVAELQDILNMKQSRISTQLAQLKQAELVQVRKSGKNSLYALAVPITTEGREAFYRLLDLVRASAPEIGEAATDSAALALTLRNRSDKARAYFDELAGKFGRTYCPGRSWKGLAETLLKLLPSQVIADLGAGEGTFSQLLAQRAERVIAIDNSEKMVEFGAALAREHGYVNLEYRLGNLEDPPIDDASVDLAFFSQALHHAENPGRAIESAFRITKPGGRIAILDLLKHDFEEARELYADVWLGFSKVEVLEFLQLAGFVDIDITVVDREPDAPHFQTLMALACRPK